MTRATMTAVLLGLAFAPATPAQARQDSGTAEVVTLYRAAKKLMEAGKTKEAAEVYEKAVAKAEVAFGRDDTTTATLMNNLAVLYKRMGQYARAEPLFRRGLEIEEVKLGKGHPEVAASLHNLADLYRGMGQYARAEPLYRRSLEIREAKLGKDHPSVATSLNNQAGLYQDMGQYAKAEPLYRRSLEIWEAKLGKGHPEVATSLHNLADLYQSMGQYARAEPLYRRSRVIWEAKLGKDHPDVASSLNGLAGLYEGMGQYAKAEPLYRRGLEIREAKLGKDHPDVATSLHSLAGLYAGMGQYAKAEPLYRRSLEIDETKLGKDHPYVATSIHNLALLYKRMNQYAKAEPLYRRGLEIREAKLGKGHPYVASSLNNLAVLYEDMGQYAKAEPLYRRSRAIWEAKLGKDHPDVATSLNNLAVLLGRTRREQEAGQHFDRARRIGRWHVASVLPALSEAEQLTFLREKERSSLEMALSLGLGNPRDATLAGLSAAWLANGKAQAHESLARSVVLSRDRSDPEAGRLVAGLLGVRRQLAALTVAAPRSGQEKEHAAKREGLIEQERALAARLRAAGSAAVAADWVDLPEVRKAIPAGGVLIDVVWMGDFDFQVKPGAKRWRPARYAAWVTPREGDVGVVDLGEAKAIDEAVAKLGKALKAAPALIKAKGEPHAEKALREPLQELSDLVLKPLLPHVGKSKVWLVSPDAALWLVPWQMLLLGDGRYAVEAHSIRYLNAGRDLVAGPKAKVEPTKALVMANPDFDLDAVGVKAAERRLGQGDEEQTRSLSSLMKLGSVRRLSGTAAEAKAIAPALQAYTGEAPRVRTGERAVKAAFLAAKHPRVLVLSTHGFFLPDQQVKKDESRPDAGERPRPVAGLENPLLRCGLLFAGCNAPGGERGVLTGLEVVGADLRGCELVALSACETGLGDVQNGEGVAGLRQAFQMAGAQAVVSTLWQVPDRQSAQLMTLFFDNLSKGRTKAASLRVAQLKVIEERREDTAAAHPFFWAAFTLTGR